MIRKQFTDVNRENALCSVAGQGVKQINLQWIAIPLLIFAFLDKWETTFPAPLRYKTNKTKR